jgi:primase-polymerase (primpol)-like protein
MADTDLGPLFPAPHTKAEFKTSRKLRPLPILWRNIPPELREFNHWVGWTDRPWRNGEKGKTPQYFGAPMAPHPDDPDRLERVGEYGIYNARPNDPMTWMSYVGMRHVFFGEFYRHYRDRRAYYGAGFMLLGSPFPGVDLDNCRNPATGEIEQWALDIIHECRSYTDVSPTGTGVKILGVGKSSGEHHKTSDGRIEFYGPERGRYFAITGHALFGYKIREFQAELDAVYARVFADKIAADARAKARPAAPGGSNNIGHAPRRSGRTTCPTPT